IEAARVAHLLVDDDDLSMQSQVRADEQEPKRSSWQRDPDVYAASPNVLGKISFQEGFAAYGIDQDTALYAALGGPDERGPDGVGLTSRTPNVKLQVDSVAGAVNIRNQGRERGPGILEQLQAVTAQEGRAQHRFG